MTGLPDFVGIGALKAGTTYLDSVLRSHPAVCMPPGVKEVQFFTRHFDRGPAWYSRHFRDCLPGTVRGEISPQYMYDEQAAERMAALVPDVKIIVSLRDPVARVYSQYKHFVTESGYAEDLPTFLRDHPGAVERSRYWRLLQRYLDVFAREHVEILLFEDLTTAPESGLPRLYAFLGVDPSFVSPAMLTPANVSGRLRHPAAYVAAKRLQTWLTSHGRTGVPEALKRFGGQRLFAPEPHGEKAFAPMSASVRRQLAEAFAPDVELLSGLLRRDLSQVWPSGQVLS